MSNPNDCVGECSARISWAADPNNKQRPLAVGDPLQILRLEGEPAYFARPNSRVALGRLLDIDDPTDRYNCWTDMDTAEVVAVGYGGSEATVIPT